MNYKQTRHFFLLLSMLLTILSITGCTQKANPEDIYQEYYNDCVGGNFDSAKLHLEEKASEPSSTLGVCAFTHDAINTIEAQKGNPLRSFSQEPIVNTHENLSSITWIDDQGNLATVTLRLLEGEWKISNTTWSY